MSSHEPWVYAWICVPKEESVWVYRLLEAEEGYCSYSTVGRWQGQKRRWIEVRVPLWAWEAKMAALLDEIQSWYPF